MSESRIDVKVLKERTIIVISRSRDIINISLEIFINVFHVLINKIEDIEKESISKENIFKKLKYL